MQGDQRTQWNQNGIHRQLTISPLFSLSRYAARTHHAGISVTEPKENQVFHLTVRKRKTISKSVSHNSYFIFEVRGAPQTMSLVHQRKIKIFFISFPSCWTWHEIRFSESAVYGPRSRLCAFSLKTRLKTCGQRASSSKDSSLSLSFTGLL